MIDVKKLSRSVKGLTVLVTGAASGMGRATAHAFADEGANVAGVDKNGNGVVDQSDEQNPFFEPDLDQPGSRLRTTGDNTLTLTANLGVALGHTLLGYDSCLRGLNKLHAEAEIIAAAAEFGLEAVILRFFSLYGPGLRKQMLWDLAQRLASA